MSRLDRSRGAPGRSSGTQRRGSTFCRAVRRMPPATPSHSSSRGICRGWGTTLCRASRSRCAEGDDQQTAAADDDRDAHLFRLRRRRCAVCSPKHTATMKRRLFFRWLLSTLAICFLVLGLLAWLFIWRSPPYYADCGSIQLPAPILTAEQYIEVSFTHLRPYVVHLESANGALVLYGASH